MDSTSNHMGGETTYKKRTKCALHIIDCVSEHFQMDPNLIHLDDNKQQIMHVKL
jgi:hypothetical protein